MLLALRVSFIVVELIRFFHGAIRLVQASPTTFDCSVSHCLMSEEQFLPEQIPVTSVSSDSCMSVSIPGCESQTDSSSNLWLPTLISIVSSSHVHFLAFCHQDQVFFLSILTAILPGEPGLASFTEAKDDGSGGDNWSYKTCTKLQSNHHQQQTNTQLF